MNVGFDQARVFAFEQDQGRPQGILLSRNVDGCSGRGCYIISHKDTILHCSGRCETLKRALAADDWEERCQVRTVLAAGQDEAVSFARDFIANPDLVRRLREGQALARFDRCTLYTPGAAGYTDYPAAEGVAA